MRSIAYSFLKLPTFVLIWFLSVLMLTACNEGASSTPTQAPPSEVPFGQMTPAQHLSKAKSIVQGHEVLQIPRDQIQDADRQIDAIPKSAPEYSEGVALRKQMFSDVKLEVLKREREKYASDLMNNLREQGFDISVSALDDKLIVSSNLLKDDTGRVQYLSNIRQNKRALCGIGFRRIAIGATGFFAGTTTYSLGCSKTTN